MSVLFYCQTMLALFHYLVNQDYKMHVYPFTLLWPLKVISNIDFHSGVCSGIVNMAEGEDREAAEPSSSGIQISYNQRTGTDVNETQIRWSVHRGIRSFGSIRSFRTSSILSS